VNRFETIHLSCDVQALQLLFNQQLHFHILWIGLCNGREPPLIVPKYHKNSVIRIDEALRLNVRFAVRDCHGFQRFLGVFFV